MSATQIVNPIVAVASQMLGRGDDGGVPIAKNDVGFNRFDYPVVRGMLASIERQGGEATRGQLRGLLTVLGKYKRQLGELGVDPEALAAAVAQGAEQSSATTELRNDVRSGAGGSAVERAFELMEAEEAETARQGIPSMASILGASGIVAQRLPGYEPRPSQIEVAQAIADAIEAEKSILAEAGTGTGKSLAYLIPAILSGQKAIVATEGKALQDQLSQKDLPFLKSVMPVDFDFAVLKGISNYACLDKWHDEAAKQRMLGKSHEFGLLEQWLFGSDEDDPDGTESGDLALAPVMPSPELRSAISVTSDECMGLDCPYARDCFALKARKRAKKAQIVVVNHTLLALDLSVRDRTADGATILPDRDLVIIDEHHALEETATKAFTDEVREFTVPKILTGKLPAKARFDPADIKAAHDDNEKLFAILHRDERNAFVVTPTGQLVGAALRVADRLKAFRTLANKAATNADVMADRKALERYADRLGNLADVLVAMTAEGHPQGHEGEIVYAEFEWGRSGKRIATLKRAPVTVAEDLRRALWARWPVVATSATLSTGGTFDYVRERTGCDRARAVSVDSPFDYRRNAMIYLPADGKAFDPSLYHQDGSIEYFDRLGREIERLLLASDGRAFCLFTSRKAMDEVHGRIASGLRWTVLKQGDYGTQEIVRRFKDDGHAVLFGLRSFWTGVDVQGEALSLVVVDKLPFPTPDEPVYQARCDLLNRQTGDKWAWFTRLALPMATMQFKQGAGRLIRSKEDRGVMALLDGRLTSKSYGTGIIRSLPPATVTRSMDAVEAFFAAR